LRIAPPSCAKKHKFGFGRRSERFPDPSRRLFRDTGTIPKAADRELSRTRSGGSYCNVVIGVVAKVISSASQVEPANTFRTKCRRTVIYFAGHFLDAHNPCYSMALTNGTKLGPYEIVAPLGAGGMGEM
jgi:hypothetical protein